MNKKTKFLYSWAAIIAITALTVLSGCKNTAEKAEPAKPAKPKFAVTVRTRSNGTIKAAPVIKDGKAEQDSIITFTARPYTGYAVDTWTVSPTEALIEGGGQGGETAKVKITEDTTVYVSFKFDGSPQDGKYKVIYTAGTGGT